MLNERKTGKLCSKLSTNINWNNDCTLRSECDIDQTNEFCKIIIHGVIK